jgi:hypothetical protein
MNNITNIQKNFSILTNLVNQALRFGSYLLQSSF